MYKRLQITMYSTGTVYFNLFKSLLGAEEQLSESIDEVVQALISNPVYITCSMGEQSNFDQNRPNSQYKYYFVEIFSAVMDLGVQGHMLLLSVAAQSMSWDVHLGSKRNSEDLTCVRVQEAG